MDHLYDMDLLDEINLLGDIDIEFLEEGKKSDITSQLEGHIIVLFSHLIKYQYNPKKQTRSWIKTIITQYKDIQKLGNKIYRYINDDMLDECYEYAYKDALKEDSKNVTSKTPKNRPYIWNIDLVTNIDSITNYLYTYYSYENVYPFDLEDTINIFLH